MSSVSRVTFELDQTEVDALVDVFCLYDDPSDDGLLPRIVRW